MTVYRPVTIVVPFIRTWSKIFANIVRVHLPWPTHHIWSPLRWTNAKNISRPKIRARVPWEIHCNWKQCDQKYQISSSISVFWVHHSVFQQSRALCVIDNSSLPQMIIRKQWARTISVDRRECGLLRDISQVLQTRDWKQKRQCAFCAVCTHPLIPNDEFTEQLQVDLTKRHCVILELRTERCGFVLSPKWNHAENGNTLDCQQHVANVRFLITFHKPRSHEYWYPSWKILLQSYGCRWLRGRIEWMKWIKRDARNPECLVSACSVHLRYTM